MTKLMPWGAPVPRLSLAETLAAEPRLEKPL